MFVRSVFFVRFLRFVFVLVIRIFFDTFFFFAEGHIYFLFISNLSGSGIYYTKMCTSLNITYINELFDI